MQTCKERFYKVHVFETGVYLLVQRQKLAQIFFFKSQETFCMTESVFYVLDDRDKWRIALGKLVVNERIDRDEKHMPMLWAVYK